MHTSAVSARIAVLRPRPRGGRSTIRKYPSSFRASSWQAIVGAVSIERRGRQRGEKEVERPDFGSTVARRVVVDGKEGQPPVHALPERPRGPSAACGSSRITTSRSARPSADAASTRRSPRRGARHPARLPSSTTASAPKGELHVPPIRAGAIPAPDEAFAKNGGQVLITAIEILRVARTSRPLVDQLRRVQPRCARLPDRSCISWLQNSRALSRGIPLTIWLGKTLQTIAHVMPRSESVSPTEARVIIAPTSLVMNWERRVQEIRAGRARPRRAWLRIARPGIDASATRTWSSASIVCPRRKKFAEWDFHPSSSTGAQTIKNMKSRAHPCVAPIVATIALPLRHFVRKPPR